MAIGVVAEFDEAAGLGTIAEDDGPERVFHCTAIADGSRTIEVGARVSYEVVPGRMGRWEGSAIQPI